MCTYHKHFVQNMNTLVRINKYLSEIGFCSRREADSLIAQGLVTVNNVRVEQGTKIAYTDTVKVRGKTVHKKQQNHVYIMCNKPIGIVCTTDTRAEKHNIIDFINHPMRIFPIGRLDKMSEGLILLTSDGDIVNKILRAGNNHQKEYIVRVHKPITQSFIKKMATGVPILGIVTRSCYVEQIDTFTFKIILTQGLNRQIRRMCEYLNYKVTNLRRIRIMNISLDIPIGAWRNLTSKEFKTLTALLSNSSKTADNKE